MWLSCRRPSATSAKKVETIVRVSQRSAVPGGWSRSGPCAEGSKRGGWSRQGWQRVRRRRSRRQPGHPPAWGRSSHVGQPGRNAGSVQRSQRGSSTVPERTGLISLQPLQRAERPWQVEHQGAPVSRRDPARCALGADRADQDGQRWAGRTERPVRAAGFDGAPAAAVDASLEVGRVSDEAARADWTSLFVAGGRLAHRAAADAAFDPGLRETAATNTLAVEGFGLRTPRWQRGQEGRRTPVTPCSLSTSMSRRTAGTGARWPAPESRAGLSSSARASRCWCDGRGATSRTASVITSGSASD